MKTLASPTAALLSLLLGFGAALSSACSSDGDAAPAGADQGGQDDGGKSGSDSGRPGEPTNSAVLIAGQAYTAEDYLTYVGVFPEVPEGDVDFENFRELGNANVTVHDGRVFVEQDGVMQRFSVDEALQLVAGPRFSWARQRRTASARSPQLICRLTRAERSPIRTAISMRRCSWLHPTSRTLS